MRYHLELNSTMGTLNSNFYLHHHESLFVQESLDQALAYMRANPCEYPNSQVRHGYGLTSINGVLIWDYIECIEEFVRIRGVVGPHYHKKWWNTNGELQDECHFYGFFRADDAYGNTGHPLTTPDTHPGHSWYPNPEYNTFSSMYGIPEGYTFLHCTDGPAVRRWDNGVLVHKKWAIYGVEYTEAEFRRIPALRLLRSGRAKVMRAARLLALAQVVSSASDDVLSAVGRFL